MQKCSHFTHQQNLYILSLYSRIQLILGFMCPWGTQSIQPSKCQCIIFTPPSDITQVQVHFPPSCTPWSLHSAKGNIKANEINMSFKLVAVINQLYYCFYLYICKSLPSSLHTNYVLHHAICLTRISDHEQSPLITMYTVYTIAVTKQILCKLCKW